MEIKVYTKREDKQKLTDYIAAMRIVFFRDLPYRYAGTFKHEEEYMNSYHEDGSVIVILHNFEQICGIGTALPFAKIANDFDGIESNYKNMGIDTDNIFYVGEIIIHTQYQKSGLVSEITSALEKFAKENSYSAIVTCNGIAEEKKYIERVIEREGYADSNFSSNIKYPTISGVIDSEEKEHTFKFWHKMI